MARIKSLKKSKRSSNKSFKKLRKRSSRKSLKKSFKKLRKRSFNKSRKSLKKKSRKMKVRTNRKIGGKKKQQLGGELEGHDLDKLNLLLPETDSFYYNYKTETGPGGSTLSFTIGGLLKEYGFSEDATAAVIEERNKQVASKLVSIFKVSRDSLRDNLFDNLTTFDLSSFMSTITDFMFSKKDFAGMNLEELREIEPLNSGYVGEELSRPFHKDLTLIDYLKEYGFEEDENVVSKYINSVTQVNKNIKAALGGLKGDAKTVEELSEVLREIIGEGYDATNYKNYGTEGTDENTVLTTKVQELKDLGNLFGIAEGKLTLDEIEQSKGDYGFSAADDDAAITGVIADDDAAITGVNTQIKTVLGELARDDTNVKQLSGVVGTLIGDGYETSDYKNYGTANTPENTKLKGIIKSKIDNEKKQMEFEKFKNEEITVYYAEIKNSDSFPGEIPAYTEITLTSKQVKRSGLVGKGYIRVEDGNIEGGGNISVSTLFGKEVNTISDIKIENWGPGAIEFSRQLEESAILLPQLSVGDVILFKNETPSRMLSRSKVEYSFASVTSVGEGGRLMKVHNGDEGVTIPEVYVKIEGMGPDQIKSSAELNAEATAEADRVAADEEKLSADIQKLRNGIAAIVGFNITSTYMGKTNFVSEIQSYGFGKDPALKSQSKKPTTEYRYELTTLKGAIEARNADVKQKYSIDQENTTQIYQKVKESEALYSDYGLDIMPKDQYANFNITGVKDALATAAQKKAAAEARAAEAQAAEERAAEKAAAAQNKEKAAVKVEEERLAAEKKAVEEAKAAAPSGQHQGSVVAEHAHPSVTSTGETSIKVLEQRARREDNAEERENLRQLKAAPPEPQAAEERAAAEVQSNSPENVPQPARRVTIDESANRMGVVPNPQISAGDTSRTGDAGQVDIASQEGGPVAGRVDAVNVTGVEETRSAAPPPPTQPLRVATVSTGAHTPSRSVSEALEKIKRALIEKRRRGSDP